MPEHGQVRSGTGDTENQDPRKYNPSKLEILYGSGQNGLEAKMSSEVIWEWTKLGAPYFLFKKLKTFPSSTVKILHVSSFNIMVNILFFLYTGSEIYLNVSQKLSYIHLDRSMMPGWDNRTQSKNVIIRMLSWWRCYQLVLCQVDKTAAGLDPTGTRVWAETCTSTHTRTEQRGDNDKKKSSEKGSVWMCSLNWTELWAEVYF